VIYHIATLAVALALFLDTISYYKQIAKTIRTKRSGQVSSSSFLYKIAKAVCALVGLGIYKNWVGLGMECFMLLVYVVTLIVICKYKPKGWKLWGK
jgi:uncharacterized protein with PQ loop repeat